jgi:hypothetical protein
LISFCFGLGRAEFVSLSAMSRDIALNSFPVFRFPEWIS